MKWCPRNAETEHTNVSSGTTKYDVAQAVWFLVSAAAVIAAYTGNAEPYVSPSQLPGGGTSSAGMYMFLAGAALALAGILVISRFKAGAWKGLSEGTDLEPEGGLGSSDLTGTVRGRPVRARTASRRTSGGEHSSNTKTVTVVEADLSAPTDQGVMVTRHPEGGAPSEVEFSDTTVRGTAVDDRFAVMGDGDEALVEALVSGRAREAMLAVDDLGALSVGDPTDALLEGLPDMSDSMLGGMFESHVEGRVEGGTDGDRSTVSVETDGTLLDAAELQRRVDAVVAVAEAVEDAETGSA